MNAPIIDHHTTDVLPKGLWRDEKTGKIALERCPKCGLENYYASVLSGVCAWCGYDANKEYWNEKVINMIKYDSHRAN